MATTRDIPDRLISPAFAGRVIIDTFKGRVRIKKWPRKTGRPKSLAVRYQNDAFTQAQALAKQAPAQQQIAAMQQAEGRGLYPRDVLTQAIIGAPLRFVRPDGTVISKWKPVLEVTMFLGALLQRSSSFTVASGAFRTINWQVPVLDSTGFWNIAQPSKLVIPAGVSVVQVMAGYASSTGGTFQNTLVINKNGTIGIVGMTANDQATHHNAVASGPIPVVAGDYFEALAFSGTTFSLNAVGTTYFALNVLGTS
jgi:hypothetical protein